jgi:acetolactate synthase-1/2/3 large subunit
LPQDALSEKITNVQIHDTARYTALPACGADSLQISEITSALMEAEEPLIITGYSGRRTETVSSLIELAETLNARVVSSQTRMNFPTSHPLFAGFDPNPYLGKADVVLVIDHDVPYIPLRAKPRADAKIIHVDIDPLKENMPMWGFPVDIFIRAESGRVLPALNEALLQKATPGHKEGFRDD